MQILLALVVVTAVILFGALISIGNERQRRAIDALREQVILWATQDIHLKREKLARDVRVDDPLIWLNRVASRVSGYDLKLSLVEHFENPPTLVCISENDNEKIIFTPLSRGEIRAFKRAKRSRLSQYSTRNPILSLSRNSVSAECSILNSGLFFDLELPLVWKALTGQQESEMSSFWMYRG